MHHAIECDDDYGACFLIENGADVNYPTIVTKETPLHLACSRKENSRSSIISPGTDLLSMDILTLSGGMNNVTTSLINKGCNINAQDCLGRY